MKIRPILALLLLQSILTVGCATNNATVNTVAEPAGGTLAVGSADASDPITALAAKADAIFNDANFANAHWGALIVSRDTGKVWYERNADRLFIPASNEKIPTTAAALLALGPDFKYVTTVAYTGELKDGVVTGDLVITGNGDPTLDEWFGKDKDPLSVFKGWAAELKAKGITEIRGRIVGDDNAWDDVHKAGNWPHAQLGDTSFAEYGPLQLNTGFIDITATPPADVNGQATIKASIESDSVTFVNQTKVVARTSEKDSSSIYTSRPYENNTMTVRGTLIAGDKAATDAMSVHNPTRFYVEVLRRTLIAEGIKVGGAPTDIDELPEWVAAKPASVELLRRESPPLSEIAKALMKPSQNVYAETMVRTMGWKASGKGSFSAGEKALKAELEKIGIAPDSFQFDDGSGLSRYNYISPRILTNIYLGMMKTPLADVWYEAQTIGGVDGTLRNRFKDTAAANNVRGKTGTVSNVRSLSGFVKTADGENLVFSFMVNAHLRSSSETNKITDPVVVMLAEFKRSN